MATKSEVAAWLGFIHKWVGWRNGGTKKCLRGKPSCREGNRCQTHHQWSLARLPATPCTALALWAHRVKYKYKQSLITHCVTHSYIGKLETGVVVRVGSSFRILALTSLQIPTGIPNSPSKLQNKILLLKTAVLGSETVHGLAWSISASLHFLPRPHKKAPTLESLFAEFEVQFEWCPLELEVVEVVEIDDLESIYDNKTDGPESCGWQKIFFDLWRPILAW